jgi:hypothetical protein
MDSRVRGNDVVGFEALVQSGQAPRLPADRERNSA